MSQLDLTIKVGVMNCTNAGFAASGTVLYGPGDLGTARGTELIGERTLDPSATERLCIHVELPSSTGNSYQGARTEAVLVVQMERTVGTG